MALFFTYPTGKLVKKSESLEIGGERESSAGAISVSSPNKEVHDQKRDNHSSKDIVNSNSPSGKSPKSWRSFPSLAFFKESVPFGSTVSSTSSESHTKGPKPSLSSGATATASKLPLRTLIFKSTGESRKSSSSGSGSGDKNPEGVKVKVQYHSKSFGINKGQIRKSLPDVTDTESPKALTEKPCDLLAQLESLDITTKADLNAENVDNPTTSKRVRTKKDMESDLDGGFDDNGNPCSPEQDQGIVNDQVNQGEVATKGGDSIGESNLSTKESTDGQRQSRSEDTKSSPSTKMNLFLAESMKKSQEEMQTCTKNEPEPRYFINAAELSEDEPPFILPTPSPSRGTDSSNFSNISYEQIANSKERSNCTTDLKQIPVELKQALAGKSDKVKVNDALLEKELREKNPGKEVSVIRPRVPISKSFPDIVQTTFSNMTDEKDNPLPLIPLIRKMVKDNSDLESLVADSLENLPTGSTNNLGEESKGNVAMTAEKVPKAFNQLPSNPIEGTAACGVTGSDSIIGNSSTMSSSIMTESQMGGLFAEKPPEAWVIDFNSLSLDAEIAQAAIEGSSRKSTSESNSNSLAFFVNIDDDNTECRKSDEGAMGSGANLVRDERRNSGESLSLSSSASEKKIFSMFVDIRGDQRSKKPSGIPQHKKPLVNKPVMNIMETSAGSSCSSKSLNRRFPSPIFQHKAAAEAARQAARSEWEKQREKYFDSLEPQSLLMMQGHAAGGSEALDDVPELDKLGPLVDSTLSNRSSLHVANVLESSFSSSIISSMETSQPTELEICQGGPCFKLGKDLLRMFQEGINTDVNINVNGKWIKAHKCILASRSQYFAAILSGHWVEKAGNNISLDGFSYSVVQFALYHIYSGTNEIPDTIDLLELATLTDLLGLEGLRENISQTFRVKFCHNFHRPCTGCITGVLECFPIALAYGMDDLHRKMVKWICKHFVRIWPTKGFANLGEELIEKSLRYSANHISVDNILDHTLGCDQLLSTMPTLRWTEPIFSIVNQLSEECVQFLGLHLSDVLQSQKFLQFGKGQAWNISRIEGTFFQAMLLLKPDEACLSHTALVRLIELGTETIDEVEWSTTFVDFLRSLKSEVEKYLLANASKAVLSRCWEQLSQDVRKRICSSSFVGYDKFGNKIVKNAAASTQNTSTKASRARPGSSTTAKGNRTLTKQMSHPVPVKPTQPVAPSPTTKVASVRPLQSQNSQPPPHQQIIPSQNVLLTPTFTQPLKKSMGSTTGRHLATNKPDSYSEAPSLLSPISNSRNASTLRAQAKGISLDREKSFGSRRTSVSTASSTASANRTPKPLTPSVPSKPSPLTGFNEQEHASMTRKINKNTPRNTSLRSQSQKLVEPPKKTFLSNSAKAAAVSKPILKATPKKPSSSGTPTNRTSHDTDFAPRSSASSQNARYLPTPSTKMDALSARSSFSNIERPKPVKSKVDSNPPRRNTYAQSPAAATTASTTTTITSRSVRRPVSGGVSGGTKKSLTSSNSHGHSSMPPVYQQISLDYNNLNDSYSRDSAMSRSTIETESGEVKVRTLAEIGRSSTFSKDEPTILGKLDGSTYNTLDVDDDYE